MLNTVFTPKSVLDVISKDTSKRPREISYFMIFDPDVFSTVWSQHEAWQHIEGIIADYYEWRHSPHGHYIEAWERLYGLSTIRAVCLSISGDLSPIHKRLRIAGLPLSQAERNIIADRAEGKLKFKSGRKKKNSPRAYLFVLLWFEIVEGEKKRYSTINRIKRGFGVGHSHVDAMLGKIYGTCEEAEIRDEIRRISADEYWTAEVSRKMKDKFF